MKVLLYLACLLPALAQITEISTDGDGQTLVLSTRFRLQAESDVKTEQKIYRWRNGVWTRLRVHIPESAGIVPGSIRDPFVAAGGGVYGWSIWPSHGLFPVVPPRPVTEVIGVTLPEGFPRESVRVSANGRFVAGNGGRPGELVVPQVLNTQTGQIGRLQLNVRFLQVASDGSFAFLTGGNQVVYRLPGQEERQFPAPGTVFNLAMSDDARWIAVDSSPAADGVGRSIRVYSTAGGSSTEVAASNNTDWGRPGWALGNSGVLYLSKAQKRLSLWDPVTQQSSVLAESAEPFVDLALSADGAVAWTVTDTNRLWRFDLRAGSREEILPPLGFSQRPLGVAVPGSAMLLPGKFTQEQRVFVGGQEWPLSGVNSNGYWFQVPWEWRGIEAGRDGLLLRAPRNPFENVAELSYDGTYRYNFLTWVDGGDLAHTATLLAAHEDFHGVVSGADPARGGETIHIYMTGFGALQREVPNGVPGPVDAVPVARPVVCAGQFLDTRERTGHLPIPAIVYASGMIGISQMELTLPKDVPTGSFGLVCWDGAREEMGILRTRP